MGNIYAAKGDDASAAKVFLQAFERTGASKIMLAALKRGEQESGFSRMWRASLQFITPDIEKEDLLGVAAAYAYAGNSDKALTSLERAYDERTFGISLLAVDPTFDRLRSDRRFQVLIRKMHVPQS